MKDSSGDSQTDDIRPSSSENGQNQEPLKCENANNSEDTQAATTNKPPIVAETVKPSQNENLVAKIQLQMQMLQQSQPPPQPPVVVPSVVGLGVPLPGTLGTLPPLWMPQASYTNVLGAMGVGKFPNPRSVHRTVNALSNAYFKT